MELLAGPNLEQYVREYRDQRIPWKEALELLLPALDGLHAIHERGYIHRDIKPGNILVTREPGCPPQAIIIDLGLVKPDRALRNAESPPTTEAGRMLCTPGYTSPEQAAGNPVDRRSDVYSMAITLYRVLAGRLPFADARGQPVLAVLAKHIYSEPTLLAKAAAGANIPPAIATVIESALRKHPNDRPRTREAFTDALRAAALESPAAPPSALHRRPHALLLVLALVVAVAWGFFPAGTTSPAALTIDAEHRAVPTPDLRIIPEQPTTVASEQPTGGQPMLPEAPPSEPESTHDTTGGLDPTLAARRVLARRKSEVQRCADQHANVERLAVVMNIDARGRVSAHAKDAEDTTLSRCLHEAFRRSPLTEPIRSLSFVQVFKLLGPAHRP
jgi:serine/threonine protein kinase